QPLCTQGDSCSFSNGSGAQSLLRVSNQRPNRSLLGVLGFSKQGSLTTPRYCQRVSRLKCLTLGCDEIIFNRSTTPKLLATRCSQKRSLPPVHTIQLLRPLSA